MSSRMTKLLEHLKELEALAVLGIPVDEQKTAIIAEISAETKKKQPPSSLLSQPHRLLRSCRCRRRHSPPFPWRRGTLSLRRSSPGKASCS